MRLTLAELGSLLLKLLDCSLVDTAALVDQVTGRGGFTRIWIRRQRIFDQGS